MVMQKSYVIASYVVVVSRFDSLIAEGTSNQFRGLGRFVEKEKIALAVIVTFIELFKRYIHGWGRRSLIETGTCNIHVYFSSVFLSFFYSFFFFFFYSFLFIFSFLFSIKKFYIKYVYNILYVITRHRKIVVINFFITQNSIYIESSLKIKCDRKK